MADNKIYEAEILDANYCTSEVVECNNGHGYNIRTYSSSLITRLGLPMSFIISRVSPVALILRKVTYELYFP